MTHKTKLALVLLFLGCIGILSTLTMEFPLAADIRGSLSLTLPDWQIRALSLIQPALFLFLAVLAGIAFYDKVGLKLPLIESALGASKKLNSYPWVLISLGGGIFCGLLIIINFLSFQTVLPDDYLIFSQEFQPNGWVRFLYGGFTEEIVVRFGLMTFLVWLCSRIFLKTGKIIFWLAISISALIFAAAHLPSLFLSLGKPEMSILLFVMISNTIAGIVFGWLYWRKGLESAILAHMVTHLVLIAGHL